MNRPKRLRYMSDADAIRFVTKQESYIDYLELRVGALTNGLNDIVLTLKNMQRDGKEDK